MRMRPGLLFLISLSSSLASAGEVFGTIRTATGSAVDGATVAAKCDASTFGPVTTDKKGAYRIVIGQTGKCQLIVTAGGKSTTLEVVSFDDAAQADIVLTTDASGALNARRG
jgi:molybdopterin biosynthesis enzyme